MTEVIKPEVAEMMVLFYVSVKNAKDYCDAINSHPEAQAGLKNNLFRPMANKMNVAVRAIEQGFRGNQQRFDEQLKKNDLLKFDEIKRLMLLMPVEQQDFLEQVAKLLITGKEISLQVDGLPLTDYCNL